MNEISYSQQALGPLDVTRNATVIRELPKQFYKGIKQSSMLKRKKFKQIDPMRFTERLVDKVETESTPIASPSDFRKKMKLPLNAHVLNIDTPVTIMKKQEGKNQDEKPELIKTEH